MRWDKIVHPNRGRREKRGGTLGKQKVLQKMVESIHSIHSCTHRGGYAGTEPQRYDQGDFWRGA